MPSPGSKRPLSSTERAISPPTKKKVKVEASVTSQTVANFFKPASQKPTPSQPKKVSWHIVNNSCIVGRYLVGQKGETQKEEQSNEIKIAAFDFDHTLIMPKSNSRFSRSASDWKWWDASVPSKLKQLAADGYTLVIVSNQKAVSLKPDGKAKTGNSDSKSLSVLKEKITTMLDTLDLDVPVSIYAATQYDEYRKPRMGMWREMVKDLGLDMSDDVDDQEASRPIKTLDLESSIFVGDAAGRKGDHSCCDRNFAANVGIQFKTPEEFFRDEPPAPVEVDVFDPKNYMGMDTPSTDGLDKISSPFTKQSDTELVLLCGSPGSGKSTFYWKHLQPLGYERVNQDILKTRQKCLKVANENLLTGKSVAVDNTNANKSTRAEWISLAKSHSLPIRCIYLSTPISVCKHNDAVRAANLNQESLNPESRTKLPGMAFSEYARRFEEPDVSEGFKDVFSVVFQFDGDKEAREIWGQHWI
ncbi:polynucleotide kinase 3'-phosphatase [Trichophyton violaceum]|uniref:Polynucleotide kinase 3'-phosphatase n=1 Tax=Trichophyton violaceum TaxID=34388 RepID=A0A178FDH7_TRIVO|nr:polynucleotide kinase 3'-phosphatase [Trichophyton violaceum]